MKLLIHWDGEIDGAFRRRLERALAELQVDFSDSSGVDADPDGPPPVRLAVLTRQGEGAPNDADLIILGGPRDVRERNGALRLDKSDIDGRTRRWAAFADKLGARLHRPALARFAASEAIEDQRATAIAFPSDPMSKELAHGHSPEVLMERLAAMTARAETAERAAATAQLSEANAIRDRRTAEAQAAAERSRLADLEKKVSELSASIESTVFALANVPDRVRAVVSEARRQAWRATLAAARAAEMAASHPDVLVWGARVRYSGVSKNLKPDEYGVMAFLKDREEIASYRGQFRDGQRSGYGVGASGDGLIWTGQWKNDEACGFGLLEAPDGARFEGEVKPDASGSPRPVDGWTWRAPAASKASSQPHRAVTPTLPSPRAAGG